MPPTPHPPIWWTYSGCWNDPSVSLAKATCCKDAPCWPRCSSVCPFRPLARAGWSHGVVGGAPFPLPHPNRVPSCSFDLSGCPLGPKPLGDCTSESFGSRPRVCPGVGAVGVSGLTCVPGHWPPRGRCEVPPRRPSQGQAVFDASDHNILGGEMTRDSASSGTRGQGPGARLPRRGRRVPRLSENLCWVLRGFLCGAPGFHQSFLTTVEETFSEHLLCARRSGRDHILYPSQCFWEGGFRAHVVAGWHRSFGRRELLLNPGREL